MFRIVKQGTTEKLILAITTSRFSSGAKYTASAITATFFKVNAGGTALEIDTAIGASGVVTLSADTGSKIGFHTALLDASAITAKIYAVVFEATIDSVAATSMEFLDISAERKKIADYVDAAISLTALDSTVAKEATLTAIKGAGWSNETLAELYDAVLTRLASKIYAGGPTATTVTVTDGTILEGDVNSTKAINQLYLKVQETGKFKIDFEFTGLTQTEVCVCFVGKYFGAGSSNHRVEGKIWNYITSVWDDILATERDFPHSNEGYLKTFTIPGTLSNYFSGVTPNITAKVRIEHVSNFNTEHQFWVDYIGLGAVEQIYMPPDNSTILSIDEAIDNATYGLAAQATKVAFIEKWINNKLIENPTGTWKLYDNDGVTVLKTWTWDSETTTRSAAV